MASTLAPGTEDPEGPTEHMSAMWVCLSTKENHQNALYLNPRKKMRVGLEGFPLFNMFWIWTPADTCPVSHTCGIGPKTLLAHLAWSRRWPLRKSNENVPRGKADKARTCSSVQVRFESASFWAAWLLVPNDDLFRPLLWYHWMDLLSLKKRSPVLKWQPF